MTDTYPPFSTWTRKRDFAYLAFFVIHLQVIFRMYSVYLCLYSIPVDIPASSPFEMFYTQRHLI